MYTLVRTRTESPRTQGYGCPKIENRTLMMSAKFWGSLMMYVLLSPLWIIPEIGIMVNHAIYCTRDRIQAKKNPRIYSDVFTPVAKMLLNWHRRAKVKLCLVILINCQRCIRCCLNST